MTDQEINEAVVRKLGIVPIHMHNTKESDLWGPKKECFCDIPDYCADIQAAWEIVEWALAREYLFGLQHDVRGWMCKIATVLMERVETAPMAICLAFLKQS